MYYLYILECFDHTYYTGITNNIENRIRIHEKGKGSKYVRARLPFKLIYSEECGDKSQALKKEIKVKKLNHKQKEELVNLKYIKT